MKVDLNWDARNSNATYRVKAKSLEEVREAMNRREEWGLFEWMLSLEWIGDARGNVTKVRLRPAFTITMPSWREYRDQPQGCKEAWDGMWRALFSHEEGHRKLFEARVAELVGQIQALRAATGNEINDMVAKTREEIQGAHDRFDTETDHGRSRGVELTVTDECAARRKRE